MAWFLSSMPCVGPSISRRSHALFRPPSGILMNIYVYLHTDTHTYTKIKKKNLEREKERGRERRRGKGREGNILLKQETVAHVYNSSAGKPETGGLGSSLGYILSQQNKKQSKTTTKRFAVNSFSSGRLWP